MQPWKVALTAWTRLHLDYAGPFSWENVLQSGLSLSVLPLLPQLLQWTAYVTFCTIWHSGDGGNGQ